MRPWCSAKAAPVRNYLKVYWPCAGGLSAVNAMCTQLRDPINSGLSAVNAIGTHLRDPLNSGLTRWRMAVL